MHHNMRAWAHPMFLSWAHPLYHVGQTKPNAQLNEMGQFQPYLPITLLAHLQSGGLPSWTDNDRFEMFISTMWVPMSRTRPISKVHASSHGVSSGLCQTRADSPLDWCVVGERLNLSMFNRRLNIAPWWIQFPV